VEGGERTYSLIRFSPRPDSTELYLRVEEPGENVVYSNVGLGEIEAFVDPQVFFDPQGNIHILHMLAMSTYLYTRADAQGKIAHQGIFKTFQQIPPRLSKMEDGSIFVAGGIEESPATVRESLSTGQKPGHSAETPPSGMGASEGMSAPLPSPSDATAQTAHVSGTGSALAPEASAH
jgi:hypothetical protein